MCIAIKTFVILKERYKFSFMKSVISNLGIFILLLGVIVVGVYMLESSVSNTMLIVSLLLILSGIIVYVATNRMYDQGD